MPAFIYDFHLNLFFFSIVMLCSPPGSWRPQCKRHVKIINIDVGKFLTLSLFNWKWITLLGNGWNFIAAYRSLLGIAFFFSPLFSFRWSRHLNFGESFRKQTNGLLDDKTSIRLKCFGYTLLPFSFILFHLFAKKKVKKTFDCRLLFLMLFMLKYTAQISLNDGDGSGSGNGNGNGIGSRNILTSSIPIPDAL